MNETEAACHNSRAIFEKCEGSFIRQIHLRSDYTRDELSISFFPVPEVGEVDISLRGIRYFGVDKPPELDGSFVDSVKATALPAGGESWPTAAERMITRFSGLPDLIWVEVVGPTGIDVICEAITVTTRPSKEEM